MNIGGWTLSFQHPRTREIMTIPARVPGNALADLHRAGIIDDPYWHDNSVRLREWEFVDWEYRAEFECDPETEPLRRELVFHGVDTVADIFLDEIRLGSVENMFLAHEFDVTERLKQGGRHRLRVAIGSPVVHAAQFSAPAIAYASKYNFESLFVRKAAHSFGWDIAPRLVGAGLWRPVELRTRPRNRWGDLYLATAAILPDRARLVLAWNLRTDGPVRGNWSGKLRMRHGERVFRYEFPIYFNSGHEEITVPDPVLWFPAGMGDPALYEVELELLRDGGVLDRRRFRTGIRTVELVRSDAERKFEFRVNGSRCFIQGSNWVPLEALHGEETGTRMRETLQLFLDSSCNMVRCWGGNVYENDAFFDFCDEHGLLVWQDFMIACVIMPRDERMERLVAEEAEQIVKALRNHPSLALWCGNNECDFMFLWRPAAGKVPPSFQFLSRELLCGLVRQHDPLRDYLPSSPYLSDENWRTKSEFSPAEQHLWGPRDHWKSDYYLRNGAVFVSEIGYHGMPPVKSLEKFLPASSLNGRAGDPGWLCHSSQPFGDFGGEWAYRTGLMLQQVGNVFGSVPESLPDLVLESQIVQAEAMKFFVETARIRPEMSGILWWNMRDCWPQFSDAVVDYYGEKKPAYRSLANTQRRRQLFLTADGRSGFRVTAVNDRDAGTAGTFRVFSLPGRMQLAVGGWRCEARGRAEIPLDIPVPEESALYLLEWDAEDGTCGANHWMSDALPFDSGLYRRCLPLLERAESR